MRHFAWVKYCHLSDEERHTIAILRKQGASASEIAHALGRHRSTIYRETKRNVSTHDSAYRYASAGELYRGRLRRSRRNRRYGREEFKPIEQRLRQDCSPQQIVGRAKREGSPVMCHETIYQWIIADKRLGGTLWRHLRCSRKLKRKRYRGYDSRGRLAGKKMITERPSIVDKRSRRGDWEIDTVHGLGPASIVTIVERKSGLVCIGPIPRATAQHTRDCTIQLLRPHNEHVLSITADNGSEFHMYKDLEAHFHTSVYFAHPHQAWERGTNENTNGLIRQYLPKGTDLSSLTQRDCNAIAYKLNHRPRLRHGFRTPYEVYHSQSR